MRGKEATLDSSKVESLVNLRDASPGYTASAGDISPTRKKFNHIGLLEEVS